MVTSGSCGSASFLTLHFCPLGPSFHRAGPAGAGPYRQVWAPPPAFLHWTHLGRAPSAPAGRPQSQVSETVVRGSVPLGPEQEHR